MLHEVLAHTKATDVVATSPAYVSKTKSRFCCTFVFGIERDVALDFKLVPRLIGRNGNNMKRISKECGAKVRIRGRGSGYLEGQGKLGEADVPLQVALSCTNYEDMIKGRSLLSNLLDEIGFYFNEYCQNQGIAPPLRLHTLVQPKRPFWCRGSCLSA
jgi:hypothetical protein